jgi:fructosamine-3-kinase
MDRSVARAVAGALGSEVVSESALSGGDINDAYRVTLADGRRVFLKCNVSAPRSMFPAEARGLVWLGEAGTLRVPRVLCVSDERGEGPAFLALELLESAPRRTDFDERLGRGLAALHRFGAAGFGLDHDNFIGSLPQANAPRPTWPAFYREQRLLPQLQRAVDGGRIGSGLRRELDDLLASLEDLVPPPSPPARLHGDLWGGNLHVDEQGMPCLIDPAAYGGDREIDLAMMRLFGGFGPRVFAAYEEAWPLPPGHERRVPLYQLYPLLVHVNLFGGGYVSSVARAVEEAGRRC